MTVLSFGHHNDECLKGLCKASYLWVDLEVTGKRSSAKAVFPAHPDHFEPQAVLEDIQRRPLHAFLQADLDEVDKVK